MGERVRIKLYVPYQDIRDNCKRRTDFYSDFEISVDDIQYISFSELIRLVKANPEYIEQLKKVLTEWDKGESG
ncbi:hypothetical protein AFV1_ORF72 [Captovirus AFV1]|uniref:Uncharacterized protein ORF72 n=1 Tax=Acidianus filamentous virus 1 (isolate United States/Yellowstone) TaxID=654909 RepID=Y072_AFV1Y|nr:hypothetical protein AFV1_ORF72 [Captovirus AFV1]Q70LE7.1 RecName: Full=Uncharacterized protein ORF72 [Acidianus filamentous virus 1 (isolate Yellowstone)]CAD98933.1 hypothetical protein [Captovirus AFV1]